MTRKLLVIGYCFPPTASPEAFVTAKLLHHLSRQKNISVDVISLEALAVAGYSDFEAGRYAKEHLNHLEEIAQPQLVRWMTGLSRLPLRPDRWVLMHCVVKRRAREMICANNYDVLITRSQYHSAHLVGLDLKKEFPDLPWIACFSDPWSGADHQKTIPLFSSWSTRQERKVLEAADRLVFPTDGLRDFMTNALFRLISKSITLPHSFDPALYAFDEHLARFDGTEEVPVDDVIMFRLFGSFYGARHPEVLLKALDHIKVPKGKRVSFEIYGSPHEAYKGYNGQRSSASSDKVEVFYMGIVPHTEALRLMGEADFLVTIDAPQDGVSFYLPSKLVDYIGSGSALVAICSEGTVATLTEAAGGTVIKNFDPAEIADTFQRLIDFPDEGKKKSMIDTHVFESGNVAKMMAKQIEALIQDRICSTSV
ncbi:hypothetical protein [Thalassospira sp.]|uniref:hypothetical protein n=1 Tax=Thalassospira sp. TaxID=1912094 RepID=UPI0032EC4670